MGYGLVYQSKPINVCRYTDINDNIVNIIMASITINIASDALGLFDFVISTPITIANVRLWTDMIFLDTDERRYFAQSQHEYLIEQVQRHKDVVVSGDYNMPLVLNHPVKEIIWYVEKLNQGFDYFDGDKVSDLIQYSKLCVNGNDFQSGREATYNRCVVPYSVHTGGALQGPTIINDIVPQHFGGFYCFTFSLNPDSQLPSGSMNFSRIDEASLSLRITNQPLKTYIIYYAINWNILRIMSGMGGMEYAN
jgi:hypothetical protein